MSETEINPENEVVKTLHNQWHKVVAVILNKLNLREIEITSMDIIKLQLDFPEGMPTVLADSRGGKFVIKLITEAEGRRLAKSH